MQPTWIDWTVIVVYFALNLAVGLYCWRNTAKRAGDFFVFGRNVA